MLEKFIFPPVKKASSWVLRHIGGMNLLSFLLLFAYMYIFMIGITSVIRGTSLRLYLPILVLDVVLTLWLARSRMQVWLAWVLTALSGGLATFFQVGQLWDELAILIWRSLEWLFLRLRALLPVYELPSQGEIIQAGRVFSNGFNVFLLRLITWFSRMFTGKANYDLSATLYLWGLVFWLLIFWMIWMIFKRQKYFLGILPGLFIMVSAIVYTGGETTLILAGLGTGIGFVGIRSYSVRQRNWRRIHLDHAGDIWLDILVSVVAITGLVVLAARTIPSFSIKDLVEKVQEFTAEKVDENDVTNALGLQESYEYEIPDVFEANQLPGMPESHLLTNPPNLSEDVFLVISVSDPIIPIYAGTIDEDFEIPRYYWRSFTYDFYNGRGWAATDIETYSYEAGRSIFPRELDHYRLVRQEIRMQADSDGILYVSGVLVSADVDYKVSWRGTNLDETFKDMFGARADATVYRVDSMLPVFTVSGLRAAGEDYPEWVKERYLQLPDSVPNRVLSLASSITATQATPFDKALALETYLRKNYTYTLEVSLPPSGKDVADHFLFDLGEGYCDYYATSMVVMARAVGLPARLVTGYTSENFDRVKGQYVVKYSQSHSWVEIFFPGYGWIPFEPTSGRPEMERPEGDEALLVTPTPDLELITLHRQRLQRIRIASSLLGIMVGSVFVYNLVSWLEEFVLIRSKPRKSMRFIFHRLVRQARQFGYTIRKDTTPREFGTGFILFLREASKFSFRLKLVESVFPLLDTILTAYERSIYSEEVIETEGLRRIVKDYVHARMLLRQARRILLWKKLFKPKERSVEADQTDEVIDESEGMKDIDIDEI